MVVIISELGDVVDFRIGDRVMAHAWLEREGGMMLVATRRLSEGARVAHNEAVLRCWRLRGGLFASRGHGRIVGDLAAPALTLGRVYRVVTRQIDRISVRCVHYEKRIGRIRSIELQRGVCIGDGTTNFQLAFDDYDSL